MPSNLHLLVVILAGYIFIHRCDYFHFRAMTLKGHRLVIEAAIAGLAIFILARIAVFALRAIDDAAVGGWLASNWAQLSGSTPFAGTLVLSLTGAPIAAWAWNIARARRRWAHVPEQWKYELPLWQRYQVFSRAEALEEAVDQLANDLMALFHEAATRAANDFTMIGVTLKSRKIYIGWVVRSPRLTEEEAYLTILPVKSGYRHSETLRPVFNYDYPVDDYWLPEANPYDYVVTLRLDEIESARLLEEGYSPAEDGFVNDVDAAAASEFDRN